MSEVKTIVVVIVPHVCWVCGVGFSNKLLDSLAKISPDVVYLIFGRTALLSTCLFWQNFLSTKFYCSVRRAVLCCAVLCGALIVS